MALTMTEYQFIIENAFNDALSATQAKFVNFQTIYQSKLSAFGVCCAKLFLKWNQTFRQN